VLASERGLVLRTYALRETSKIVGVLGFEHGRLRLVAHGGRAARNRFASCLEVGNEIDLVYSLGPGRELGTLREAVLRRAHLAGANRLSEMGVGLAAIELLDRLVPEGAHEPGLAEETAAMLGALRSAPDRGGVVLLFYGFELRLLGRLGARPGLETCAGCGRSLIDSGGQLDVRAGAISCGACPGGRRVGKLALSPEALRTLAALGRLSWPEIARLVTPAPERRILGLALHRLLTAHVERYRLPRSLALLQKVDGGGATSSTDDTSAAFRPMA